MMGKGWLLSKTGEWEQAIESGKCERAVENGVGELIGTSFVSGELLGNSQRVRFIAGELLSNS